MDFYKNNHQSLPTTSNTSNNNIILSQYNEFKSCSKDIFSQLRCCNSTYSSLYDLINHRDEYHNNYDYNSIKQEQEECAKEKLIDNNIYFTHGYCSSNSVATNTNSSGVGISSNNLNQNNVFLSMEDAVKQVQLASVHPTSLCGVNTMPICCLLALNTSSNEVKLQPHYCYFYYNNSNQTLIKQDNINNTTTTNNINKNKKSHNNTNHSIRIPTQDINNNNINSNNLVNMVVDESEQRPHKCPIKGCEKRYKNINGLKYHTMKGLCGPVKNYIMKLKCTRCNKTFRSANGLRYHVDKAHNKNIVNNIMNTISNSNIGNSNSSSDETMLLSPSSSASLMENHDASSNTNIVYETKGSNNSNTDNNKQLFKNPQMIALYKSVIKNIKNNTNKEQQQQQMLLKDIVI